MGIVAGYKVGFAKYFIDVHGGSFHRYTLAHQSLIPHVGYRWDLGEHLAISA